MASDKIRGLSVKIGADTSDFIKALKGVDREISQTQRTANELQKGLQLEFDSKRFIQAQKHLQESLSNTEQKAEAIRKQLKFLEESGGINTEGYRKLQTELAKSETNALKLKEQLDALDKIKLENANKGISNLSSALETAAKKTTVLSAGAAAAIAGIAKLGNDARETGDTIQTLADQYSMSAEAIQRWQYIAMQTDTATEELFKGVNKVGTAIAAYLVGETNNATKALQELGIALEDAPNAEDAFYDTIVALAEIEDSSLRAYYATMLFGEDATIKLIPLLKQGADSLAQYNKEFESVGYLSGDVVKQLASLDGELDAVNQRLQIAKTELGIALLPVFESLASILEEVVVPAAKSLAEWFASLSPEMQKVITGALLLVTALGPVLLVLSKITGVIPQVIKLLTSLKDASLATYAGFAALAGALGLTFDIIGNWSQMSTLEKVLKSIALAALVAAAAVAVFHASWSLGLAVGAITAAVVAGIAAINSAGKSIGIDTNFTDTGSISGMANQDYSVPQETSSGQYNNVTNNADNSQVTNNITINAGNADAGEVYDIISKKLAIKIQSRS